MSSQKLSNILAFQVATSNILERKLVSFVSITDLDFVFTSFTFPTNIKVLSKTCSMIDAWRAILTEIFNCAQPIDRLESVIIMIDSFSPLGLNTISALVQLFSAKSDKQAQKVDFLVPENKTHDGRIGNTTYLFFLISLFGSLIHETS